MIEKKAEAEKQAEDAGIQGHIEKQQKKESITTSIRDFFGRQKLKHVVQTLKKFELEETTPIFIKDGKAIAFLKEAQEDLGRQGKLSLSIKRHENFEIPSRDCDSIVDGKATVVKKLVLPDEDKILALTESPVVGTFMSKPVTLARLVLDVVQGSRRADVLERISDFQDYFVNPAIEPKDVAEKKWELVTTGLTADIQRGFSYEHGTTKYYSQKLREMKANSTVDVHVHPRMFSEPWDQLSLPDIRKYAIYDRSIKWLGVLVVERGILPEEFIFKPDNLTMFRSPDSTIGILSPYWVEEGTPKADSLKAKFDKTHRAKRFTWGELLADF